MKRKNYERTKFMVKTDTSIQIGPFASRFAASQARWALVQDWRAGAGHTVKHSFISGKHKLYANGHLVMTVWIGTEKTW